MNTTVNLSARFLPLLLILLLESGCTYALWTNGNLDAYKEPAPAPNLRLFESQKKNDFLVVYTEYSERSDSAHTRAYWLNKNQNRIEDKRAPAFARKKAVNHLPAVLVFYSAPKTPESGQKIYAVCDTNLDTFALYSDNRELGSYDLPVYKDHRGTAEKIALTPIAVSADVTVAGTVAAVYAAYVLAQLNYGFRVGK